MNLVTLDFHGYTWEQFLGQIAGSCGIILSYRGKLDPEGFVVVLEILHVSYGTSLDLEESQLIKKMRESFSPSEQLFFSFAKVEKKWATDVVQLIVHAAKPKFNYETGIIRNDLMLLCKGACDFLPEQIINTN